MTSCNHCGVELDSNMDKCPLCGLPIGEKCLTASKGHSKGSIFNDQSLSELENMTVAQKRKLFWEISGIILVSGIMVTLIINFVVDKNITWSKYNIVASLSLLANISFFTIFRKRAFVMVVGTFISNAILLLFLDYISYRTGWGLKLGIPLLMSLYVLIIVVIWLIRISHERGLNILGIVVIAAGLFLICTETFISLYFNDIIRLRWSIIAGSSIIPISALLFFAHYRLKKGTKLHRFFNI